MKSMRSLRSRVSGRKFKKLGEAGLRGRVIRRGVGKEIDEGVVRKGLLKRKRENEEKKLAEQVIRAVKLYRQMFVEQDEEDEELKDIEKGFELEGGADDELMRELDNETVGEDIEQLVDVIKEKGGDEVEVEVTDDTAVKVTNGENAVVIRLAVDDGEPQLILNTEDSESKITVSLAPVMGAVTTEEDIINTVIEDEEVKEEVTGFIVDLVTEGEAEVTTEFENMLGGTEEEGKEEQEELEFEREEEGDEDVEEKK